MKKILPGVIFLLAVSFVTFPQEASGDYNGNSSAGADVNWWLEAVGLFSGVISSGQVDLPGLTNFYIGIDGTLRGEYEIKEGQRTVSGRLYESDITAPYEIKFKWKDSYGVGDLFLRFNSDVTEFEGYWSIPGDRNKYLWTGSK